MADYPRITGTIRPTPRNRVSGFLADLLEMGAKGYDVGSTLQAGGPITEGKLSTPVSDLLGIPELQRTLNRVSYNEPLTTGTGYTTRLRPDTISAAMTVAPMVGPTARVGAAGARMTGTALKDLATSDVAYNAAMNAMRRSGGLAELTAYHGTPHRFAATEVNPLGEFRSSQIGTGEGAQVYGHGLYFAENPEVAKGYKKTLAYKAFDVEPEAEKIGIPLTQGSKTEFYRQANANSDPYEAAKRFQYASIDARKIPQEKLAELFKGYYDKGGGTLYHVDLPDPMVEKMLHWDKPLSQDAPQEIKDAMNKLWQTYPELKDKLFQFYKEKKPGSFYYALLNDYAKTGDLAKNQAFASEALRKAGIPGIQYFDEGSRGAGKGTRNFVVFPGEEKNLTILKRE